jgi:hypothetical protein
MKVVKKLKIMGIRLINKNTIMLAQMKIIEGLLSN